MNCGQSYQVKSQERLNDDMALLSMEKSLNRLTENNAAVQSEVNKIIRDNEKYGKILSRLKKSKEELRKKILSTALIITASLSVISGSVASIYIADYNAPGAIIEIKVYSEVEEPKAIKEYDENYTEDKDYLKVYGTFDETSTRVIKTYNISDYDFESPKEALHLDISTLEPTDVSLDEKTEEAKPEGLKEYYTERFIAKGSDKAQKYYLPVITAIEAVLIGALTAADLRKLKYKEGMIYNNEYGIKYDDNGINGILSRLYDVKTKLKEYKEDASEKEKLREEIKTNIDIAMRYIKANRLYNERFLELFNKYSYLYSDPSSIYEKFEETSDSIKDDVTLSLIKEIKSSLN